MKKGTRTSKFGVSKREGHDASLFYSRQLYKEYVIDEKKVEIENTIPLDVFDKILCQDSRKMENIPDSSVHFLITSPPYNLKNSTGNGMKDGRGGKWANAALVNGYSHHSDDMPHDEYVAWQRSCLEQMMRVVKEDGEEGH